MIEQRSFANRPYARPPSSAANTSGAATHSICPAAHASTSGVCFTNHACTPFYLCASVCSLLLRVHPSSAGQALHLGALNVIITVLPLIRIIAIPPPIVCLCIRMMVEKGDRAIYKYTRTTHSISNSQPRGHGIQSGRVHDVSPHPPSSLRFWGLANL